ncbi:MULTISPECIES: D-alanyl-D-alanine carboxypeptidase family protein [Paenarthrobacter]|uniref:M15 family metallopeptidase n=1 Tax=Paenarthrobacter TaxID=1742992 RepID=UPI00074D4174|nr:M15 family metallopeptidase [Paenarthrobacter ureafaciens]AMB41820.1 D-alanyl-D-alanine carboxypeptidase [Arthrobacter sp. ATCC 21022]RWW94505.1 D-alanyl-D-alanine carboxypeptidase family protein [Paenarthrobacter ureafaciens]
MQLHDHRARAAKVRRRLVGLAAGLAVVTGSAAVAAPANATAAASASAAHMTPARVGATPNSAPPSSVTKAALPATVNPLPSVDPISDPASFSVLVNKSRPLNPASYAPGDLINARGSGQYLRAEAAAWLNGLFQGAADAGTGGLSIVSGYRSYAQQQQVYAYYVSIYGQAYADTISARPGYSEHQTGLAVDVGNQNGSCGLSTCFGDTVAGRWVAANAHKYGFIVRYPNGYTGTTGYSYEPWHLRYVGVALATDMNRRGYATMEQYFAGNPAAAASIKSGADLVAADSSGRLLRYPATAVGSYAAPVQIGSGWTGLKQGFVVDWDIDGVYDILAQWNNGVLGVYRGLPGGGFAGQVVVGNGGWDRMTITVGKWSHAHPRPSVVGYFPDGVLRYYPNTFGGALSGPQVIGTGWNGLELTMADWEGDGANDIIARRSSGALINYRGDGWAGFYGPAMTVGTGWQYMRVLTPSFGLTGAGTRGITAQTMEGNLYNYGLGRGQWTTYAQVGSGWNSLKLFK